MKRVIINSLAMFALGYLLLTTQTTKVKASASSDNEDSAGAVVCSPDVYFQPPDDCLPLGPSEYLTEMARLGITFPLQPLLAISPDPGLNDLPYLYYKVNPTGTQLYPSLEAAIKKQGANRIIPRGRTLYVVYNQVVDTGKGVYYQLPSEMHSPRRRMHRIVTVSPLGISVNRIQLATASSQPGSGLPWGAGLRVVKFFHQCRFGHG